MAASDAPPVVEDDDSPAPIKQRTQPHLMPQDAKTVDAAKLTALTPEVVRLWGTWSLLAPMQSSRVRHMVYHTAPSSHSPQT
jgi:hypothetical protein